MAVDFFREVGCGGFRLVVFSWGVAFSLLIFVHKAGDASAHHNKEQGENQAESFSVAPMLHLFFLLALPVKEYTTIYFSPVYAVPDVLQLDSFS